jgi:hypothetical protein
MLTSICIYASQLASCINHNRFKKPSDALETVWQRVAPASFREALTRNGIKTQEEAVRDIMTSNQTVKSLLVHAEDALTTTSGEVARGYEEITKKLEEAELKWEERKLVDDAMKKTLYTSFGTRQESVAFQKIHARIPCRLDDTFYRSPIGEVNGVTIFVGGKVDAISQDGSMVVEIKNRINRLFFKIPVYEIIQVQTYLQLLPEVENARLVECLTKDNGDVVMNMIPIERDQEMWDTYIVPKVKGFVSYLLRLLDDPAEQDTYLQSRRRASVVTAAINSISIDDHSRTRSSHHPVNERPDNSQQNQDNTHSTQPIFMPQNLTHGFSLGLSQEI